MQTEKVFNTQSNIGRVRHVVNYHDGEKRHADNSPFFDIRTFSRKRDMERFTKELKAAGYKQT